MNKKRIYYMGLFATGVLVLYYILLDLSQNDGRYIYPLDDAYIHMAIAKNFSVFGNWGITRYDFSSTTSSPFYTLLLSGVYLLFGVHDLFPLLLNLSFGFLFLYSFYRYANKNLDTVTYAVCSAMIILFTPLHIQIISGMEHTLHILLTFWLVVLSVELLNDAHSGKSKLIALLSVTAIIMLTRYESVFLILIIAFTFGLRRKFRDAMLILLAGIIPVIIYGIISKLNGSMFLPNSVLLKGNMPEFSIIGIKKIFYSTYYEIFNNHHILSCLFLLLFTIYVSNSKGGFRKMAEKNRVPLIVISAIILHLAFARTGWFFRYESYLMVLTFVAIAPLISKLVNNYQHSINLSKTSILSAITLLSFLPFFIRYREAAYVANRASYNIYEQQIQMAGFLNKYYPSGKIVANDVGAISYYNEIRLFDLAGVASVELLKNTALPKKQFVDYYTKKNGYEIAIVYDGTDRGNAGFKSDIPDNWKKTGEWTIKDNRVCAHNSVSFYAIDSNFVDTLMKNLKEYSRMLKKDIEVKGAYLNGTQ